MPAPYFKYNNILYTFDTSFFGKKIVREIKPEEKDKYTLATMQKNIQEPRDIQQSASSIFAQDVKYSTIINKIKFLLTTMHNNQILYIENDVNFEDASCNRGLLTALSTNLSGGLPDEHKIIWFARFNNCITNNCIPCFTDIIIDLDIKNTRIFYKDNKRENPRQLTNESQEITLAQDYTPAYKNKLEQTKKLLTPEAIAKIKKSIELKKTEDAKYPYRN